MGKERQTRRRKRVQKKQEEGERHVCPLSADTQPEDVHVELLTAKKQLLDLARIHSLEETYAKPHPGLIAALAEDMITPNNSVAPDNPRARRRRSLSAEPTSFSSHRSVYPQALSLKGRFRPS